MCVSHLQIDRNIIYIINQYHYTKLCTFRRSPALNNSYQLTTAPPIAFRKIETFYQEKLSIVELHVNTKNFWASQTCKDYFWVVKNYSIYTIIIHTCIRILYTHAYTHIYMYLGLTTWQRSRDFYAFSIISVTWGHINETFNSQISVAGTEYGRDIIIYIYQFY